MIWTRGIRVGIGPGEEALRQLPMHGRARERKDLPPHRGWGLGLRLALLVSITVGGVMAAVSGFQLAADLRGELRDRQALLAASLSPLVSELRLAPSSEAARGMLTRFHASYLGAGHMNHYTAVTTNDGEVLFDAGEQAGLGEPLTASVPLIATSLAPGRLQVQVALHDERFSADRAQRWRAWAVHVALTAMATVLVLFAVIRREVTGPVERLLGGIRKMELGYWDDVPDPGGAWELRWLAWRFRTIGGELRLAVGRLMAAQRRAYAVDGGARVDSDLTGNTQEQEAASLSQPAVESILQSLEETVAQLQASNPGDAAARRLAELAWKKNAQEAEKAGFPELRIRLEDAALHVLQPEAFSRIHRQLNARRLALVRAGLELSTAIEKALAARGVPFLSIRHRIKHVAGVWRKMREKELSLEQVHDLLALRIVVPTVADCYHALGVVHDLHEPMVDRFKDYIEAPKDNGYQGLHTSVRSSGGFVFEVQIRSVAMHQLAEHGDASHWTYKAEAALAAREAGTRARGWNMLVGVMHRQLHRG